MDRYMCDRAPKRGTGVIEVELRAVPQGEKEYVPVARLTVADDGQLTTWDPEGLIPTDVPVLVATPGGGLRRVSVEEDPATYARHMDTILRTGYLVPVVTADTGQPA